MRKIFRVDCPGFEPQLCHLLGFPGGSDSKESACNAGDQVQCQGQEDPLEK